MRNRYLQMKRMNTRNHTIDTRGNVIFSIDIQKSSISKTEMFSHNKIFLYLRNLNTPQYHEDTIVAFSLIFFVEHSNISGNPQMHLLIP